MKTLLLIISSTFLAAATVPVPTYIGTNGLGGFSVKVSDALGISDVDWVDISIGSPGAGSCMGQWSRGNFWYLFADNGSTALGGIPQGTNTTLENSQCRLKVATTNATVVNGELWFWVDLQFLNYTGPKTIWMVAGGSQGHDGWHAGGTVTVGQSAIPVVSLANPAAGGAGVNQSFTVRITDAAGTSDISWMNFSIDKCLLQWNQGDYLQLFADNGTSIVGGGTAGSSGAPQNSDCRLNLAGSTGSTDGFSKFVTFSLTFLSVGGIKPMYGIAGSPAGNNGWVNLGTWNTSTLSFGDVSSIDTGISATLQDDVTGNMYQNPTSINPWSVHLKNGHTVTVKSHGKFNLARLNYSHEPVGDAFAYHFTVDTRQVWGFRIGDTEDTFWLDSGLKPVDVQPNSPRGWTGGPFAWHNLDSKGKSESSEFSLTSKWRPGPISMYLVDESAKEPVPVFPDTESNQRVHSVANIFDNSLKKFVIGPAIKPDITNDEMQMLLGRWVEDYGFAFLQPLRDGKTLADLEPSGDFETEIVRCLRNVTPKAN